ncbi:MAG: hypothetical protein QM809_05890 [Gordonia sp. (in: high G+C Gram-positive bacteria)]|uniref:hypothetical protein n=1 Tax=Gordonia sp. (in: high G+C Gram-positive bacteria) TaxID=84139 RepID=UPI0039E23650
MTGRPAVGGPGPGRRRPGPSRPQMPEPRIPEPQESVVQADPPTGGRNAVSTLVAKTPPLPVALGAVLIVCLLSGGAVSCGGSSSSSSGSSYATSRESLCAAYRELQARMSDTPKVATEGPEMGRLASAAKSYPDAGIRSDGETLEGLHDDSIATNAYVRARMGSIVAECD